MSASALRLVVSGADFSGVGIGNFKTPLRLPPYAMYPLASALVSGSSYAVGADLCGGAACAKVGTPTDSGAGGYATCSPGNYWTSGIDQTTLAAAGSNTMTLIMVGRVPSANTCTIIGNFPETNSHELVCFNNDCVSAIWNGNSAKAELGTVDANRGNRLGMFAGVFTSTTIDAYAEWTGSGGLLTGGRGTQPTAHTITGGTMGLGQPKSGTSLNGGSDVSCAIVYASALTPSQLSSVFNDLVTWYSSCGVTL